MFKSLWNFFGGQRILTQKEKKIRLELMNKIEFVKVKYQTDSTYFFSLVFGLFCSVWHLFQNRSVFHCCCYCRVCVFFFVLGQWFLWFSFPVYVCIFRALCVENIHCLIQTLVCMESSVQWTNSLDDICKDAFLNCNEDWHISVCAIHFL